MTCYASCPPCPRCEEELAARERAEENAVQASLDCEKEYARAEQAEDALRRLAQGAWVECDVHDAWAAPVGRLSEGEPECQCEPCSILRPYAPRRP